LNRNIENKSLIKQKIKSEKIEKREKNKENKKEKKHHSGKLLRDLK
jgi:hypothetical protein